MVLRVPILCMACTRLQQDLETCTAYPSGIPADILDGADHHAARGNEVDGLVFNRAMTPAADVALTAWLP